MSLTLMSKRGKFGADVDDGVVDAVECAFELDPVDEIRDSSPDLTREFGCIIL